MLNTNLRELLTRYATGDLDNMPEEIVDKEIESIIENVHILRKELNRVNVLSALIRLYPDSVYPSVDLTADNEALIFVAKQQQTKQKLIKFDAEISEALLRKQDDPTFDWNELVDKLTQIFHNQKQTNNYVTLDTVSFKESKVVASFGLPELDNYLGGGIGVGSVTVYFAPVNVGKTTIVTRNLAARLLEQGKRPLIISLEGDPNKLAIKIISQLLGFGKKDIKDFTDYEKEAVIQKSQSMPNLPIINCKASKKWEIQKLIRTYEPDVIIYDQLTIGAGGREWQQMAQLSNILKTIAAETGIPIVALTQSTEKNYHGADKKNNSDDDGDDSVGQIKYGQSILEDADNVIHIAKPFGAKTKRRLTIVKTRDDSSAQLLPIKLMVDYTDNGVVYVKDESEISIVRKEPQNKPSEFIQSLNNVACFTTLEEIGL